MARRMPDADNHQRASTGLNGRCERSATKVLQQATKADTPQQGDALGSWGDNNLALLSAQASDPGLQTPDKRSSGTVFCCEPTNTATHDMVRPSAADSAKRSARPCNSEGLTIESGDEAVASGTKGDRNAQEVTQPLRSADGDASAAEDALRRLSAGSAAADLTAGPAADNGAALQQSPPDAPGNSAAPDASQPGGKKPKRRSKKRGLYADVIGKEVNVPASIFDIQVPDLFYRAIVKRKDTGHPGAVVIRFPEDGSHFWLPVEQVRQYIADMEMQPDKGQQSLAGERSATFAAEVLVSLSGAQTDSGSAGDTLHLHAKQPQQRKQKWQQQPGGSEVESAMATPGRKRRRKGTA